MICDRDLGKPGPNRARCNELSKWTLHVRNQSIFMGRLDDYVLVFMTLPSSLAYVPMQVVWTSQNALAFVLYQEKHLVSEPRADFPGAHTRRRGHMTELSP